jgi:hypothetical protein
LDSLTALINDANNSLNDDHSKGMDIGKDLIKNSISHLKLLKNILGTDDIKYQSISDKLANQIMQCGILCFNKTADDKDYMSSYKYAKSISFKDSTIERANTTIKHCEDELKANICGFCNSNEVIKHSSMRVKMHKMNWDNTYSYFKNGGLEVTCCKSCSSSNSNKKIKAFFIGLFIWAAISAGTFGWFLGIDLLFARFSMSLWIFKKIKTKFYYDEISFHPMILKLKLEGYQFGMP